MKHIKTKGAVVLLLFLLIGCAAPDSQKSTKKDYKRSYEAGATEGFCELVSYGVKRLGLGVPMSPEEMEKFLPYAEKSAERHKVSLYIESDLIDTDLFTRGIAKGKDVPLIYTGTTLVQYLDLKADRQRLDEIGAYRGKAREEIARRFGRLLSYTPRTINNQLALHTDFRTMYHFGIQGSNLYYYYEDLAGATSFYTKTLGLKLVNDTGTTKTVQMADDSYLTLVDAAVGQPYANEPKTVALALLTNQLDEWVAYLKKQDVDIRSGYNSDVSRAHNSFVIADPEGYLLEFERFNQHPENEVFIPILKQIPPIKVNLDADEDISLHSNITWLYYRHLLPMQHFYEDVLGLEMICDQGWAKIYQGSESGFIGLVDEKRGMHTWVENKAVVVSFIVDDLKGWFNYVKENDTFRIESSHLEQGDKDSKSWFVGVDPEGYHMRFTSQ